MAIKTLIKPAIEPVTLAETKAWLRLDQNAEDALINTLIESARIHSETITNRAMITRTVQETTKIKTDSQIIELSIGPVQSIVQLANIDRDGSLQIIDSADYVVDLAYNRIWVQGKSPNPSFQVDYVAGYGDAITDVPAPLKNAILLQIAWLFENRDATNEVMPHAAQVLLAPYTQVRL